MSLPKLHGVGQADRVAIERFPPEEGEVVLCENLSLRCIAPKI